MIEIKLSKNGWLNRGKYVALVDDKYGYLANINWTAKVDKQKKTIYAQHTKTGQLIHRIIMGEMLGYCLDKDMQVDHIDGNGLNNLESNLRIATNAENNQNKGIRADNTSTVKGVSWRKDISRWVVYIHINGKRIHLGYFADLEEAKKVRRLAVIQYHGDFGHHE